MLDYRTDTANTLSGLGSDKHFRFNVVEVSEDRISFSNRGSEIKRVIVVYFFDSFRD